MSSQTCTQAQACTQAVAQAHSPGSTNAPEFKPRQLDDYACACLQSETGNQPLSRAIEDCQQSKIAWERSEQPQVAGVRVSKIRSSSF